MLKVNLICVWFVVNLKATSKSGFTSGVEQRKEDINHEFGIAANFNANDAASISLYHIIQVNLCQKLLFFLHQLTHNMTTDCSLDYKFNTYVKIPGSEHGENMLYTEIIFDIQNNFSTQNVLPMY